MIDVYNFILTNFSRAFSTMSSFEIFPGLNLLQFFVVIFLIEFVFTLIFTCVPRANSMSTIEGFVRALFISLQVQRKVMIDGRLLL